MKVLSTMNNPIKNSLGETLDYSFAPSAADLQKTDWLIILGHGVTGNKDRPVIADTAKALNAAGFDTLRFSFAGNGDSEGDFRDATISKEVGDLSSVLDAVSSAYPKIAYIGHSMGGAVGVIQASRNARITALVSLAGMVDTHTFAQTEFGEETPDQGLMWEDEDCPLSAKFMHDLCETIQSVAPLAECVTQPWLLIHGTTDDIVQPKDTDLVESLKGDAVKVVRVTGADHSFNEPDHKTQMTQAVVDWLQEQAS
ncbi:alpha/beta hydrolase [Coraliomargarita sp. W4R72]